eukprot:CAMPEP_0182500880 /NCGR_PEP_ID=MMETSP1321-20130603/10217_1 /TAXON_ID=91990 /ORGANISM="Bolidomonas sp., Strain RCC1657" /LENGTH=295 /DNA_ID=CAMNT_0024705439 /DNA_START=102 /DNA_END=986 /DNA_ORIENTATION=-
MSMWSDLGPRPSLSSSSASGSFAYTPSDSLNSSASAVTLKARAAGGGWRGPSRKTFSSEQKSNQSPEELVENLRIKQSFSATSFNSMRSLPSDLKNGEVSRVIKEKLQKVRSTKYDGPLKKFSPLPSQFSYPPHAFNGPPPTISSRSSKKLKPFLPSNPTRPLKHEQLMPDPANPQTYPYSSSPYDEAHRYWQDQKLLENRKILHGEFRSSGVEKVDSSKITYLPTQAKLMYSRVKGDWGECNFEVGAIFGEGVELMFQANTVDSSEALFNYMEVMAETDGVVLGGKMKRDKENW